MDRADARVPGDGTRTWLYPLGGGLAAGLVSGLFGVGGGVLFIPVLVLLLRRAQHVAHATSLVAITIPAVVGATRFAIDGEVAWVGAAAVAAGAIVGVQIGAWMMPRIPDRQLRLLFAAILAIVALRLIAVGDAPIGEGLVVDPTFATVPLLAHAVLGVAVGTVSALLGIGGGVVVVPSLVLLFGYGQHLAEGTSLAIIVPTALLGAVTHARRGYTDWPLGLKLGAGAFLGALVGAELALALPPGSLARAFGILLAIVTALMVRRSTRGG